MHSRRGRFNNSRNNFFRRGTRFRNNAGPPHIQKKEYRHIVQLTEPEVGITQYIGSLEGFSGIIKARYSDFHVNEINLEGTIAKVTETGMPKDFLTKVKGDYKEVEKSPLDELPQETWESIKNILTSENTEIVNLEADNLGKETRTKIHDCIKTHFGSKVVASTVTLKDGKKYMQFKKYLKGEKTDFRFQWPNDKGEYVYFLVYKEAIDTMDACLKISDCLRMSPSHFTYAGVKDKRAKTTQWFCARKVEPWKLIKNTRQLRNVKIGNFSFKNIPLKIGDLQGNKFRIALRNVVGNDDLINKAMEHVQEHGFINYYGLQRFGNDKEVPTFEIGKNLLLGNWKEAVEMILKPIPSDDPREDVSKAKKIYAETGDAARACGVLEHNKNKCVEARLLEGLKRGNEKDYVNALENIPRNMRLLYLHAFQSLIWNKMVSKRLQLFGMKPVEGDFVLVDRNEEEEQKEVPLDGISKPKKENSEDVDNPEDINVLENIPQGCWETKLYENHSRVFRNFFNSLQQFDISIPQNHKNRKRSDWITNEIMFAINEKQKLYKLYIKNKDDEVIEHKYKDTRNKLTLMVKNAKKAYLQRLEQSDKEEFKYKQQVKSLTNEDISNYTIFDIVLPLPGYDVSYPENLKQCYKENLEEYGLTLEMPQQRVKTYTLSGNYRKILGRVTNMSWNILHYDNPTCNLIRSDYEELIGHKEPENIENGKYKALVMEFHLPASSYATMVLREILKTDTSSSSHARLNDYHEANQVTKQIVVGGKSNEGSTSVVCEAPPSSSLLSDPEKYEEFKNNVFKSSETASKRKLEDEKTDSLDDSKKLKPNEKKKDSEECGIKMEPSFI